MPTDRWLILKFDFVMSLRGSKCSEMDCAETVFIIKELRGMVQVDIELLPNTIDRTQDRIIDRLEKFARVTLRVQTLC